MLDQLPVIVGIGEAIDRPADLEKSLEPLAMMAAATKSAEEDAGAKLISRIDSIDVIKHVSIPYPDLPRQLAEMLALGARCKATLSDGSGNGPLREIHNAALRIQRGESEVALICGAEAQWSVDQAKKRKLRLRWMPDQESVSPFAPRDFAHPLALKYGLTAPAHNFPLYENAATASWGQTPADARAESASIWSTMSRVASQNPYAWLPRVFAPEEIAQPSTANRPIAWPYLKFMVAQPSVNLAAAIILTSVRRARALGIAVDRMVFIHGGAAAREADDYLQRDRYDASPSQNAVLTQGLALMGWQASQVECVDLYSCFPVVPKMARRTLGISAETPLTVAGGLTFLGGPIHSYMAHATTAMTRKLRSAPNTLGLLYGQGGAMTKHHALVVSSTPPDRLLPDKVSVQEAADAARGPIPELADDYSGPADIETFTVVYDRDGQPAYGVVLSRIGNAQRALARVPATDRETISLLEDLNQSPVGRRGRIRAARDGSNHWIPA